ncbi:NAD-dependent succinate-semialdehyde dehydrogenase [Aeromicrobium sp. CF4.19]|uniref:NAD-dependent succinate-semialdehyde dehydrogenase n=1 Tax=Aeromicrobium sp. CF4.19 TaxID=3373082 RepID=UPI003EE75545
MSDRQFPTIDPFTEDVIETYAYMSDAEATAVVDASQAAFLDWRLRSLQERAEVIGRIGQELRASKEEFARLMSREVGKLVGDGEDEVELCAAICDYTAEQGPQVLADQTRDLPGAEGLVTHAPMGLIYGIQPWNFPAYQAVRYSIASLMAGNGVLLKHAESCTGSGLFLRDVFERAGLPQGLFGVLVIDHDQSDTIIENDDVRGVTLTGSNGAGQVVGAKAASVAKKSVLELGSNDAYVVLDDADLDVAVEACVAGRLYNNGETCVNAKRFIVTEANYDAFVQGYRDRFAAVRMGDPSEDGTHLGPLVTRTQRDEVHQQVEQSVSKGARVLVGGEIPDRTGWFYPATVLVDVAPGQPAYDDELFGPVASIIRATDDEDAMRLANDSRFGLGGGIFSRDTERARELAAKHFDTGMVYINTFDIAKPNMPFGGVKASGYGREHGPEGLKEWVNIKSVVVAAPGSSE